MSNHLTGALPPQLGSLTNLKSLDLYDNQFTGTLSSELSKLYSLESIRLHGNLISGTVPDDICGLSQLERLIIDCQALECPTTCDCRSVDIYQRHYSCPIANDGEINNCKEGYVELRVEIVPNSAPEETTWEITIDGQSTIGGDTSNNDVRACIPLDACSVFSIYDLRGDGICCDMGYGSYTLFLNNQLYYYGGNFMDSESISIGYGCGE